MIIKTKDNSLTLSLGSASFIHCFYSTIDIRVSKSKDEIPNALALLENRKLEAQLCFNAAREFNIIRDELSNYPPEKVIWDKFDLEKTPPWGNNISKTITSLGNYYLTAEGKDLIFELICFLQYAAENKKDVELT